MIGADPDFFLTTHLASRHGGLQAFDREALAEYRAAFRSSACIHATCEDYRAAATIDLEDDETDIRRQVQAPLLVLWGKYGVIERCFKPIEDWQERVASVTGRSLACGHYLAEELPAETAEGLRRFFGR